MNGPAASPRRAWRRTRVGLRAGARSAQRTFERMVMPPITSQWHGGDFRRVVILVAFLAVGFFVPSLALASVPQELWIPFGAAAVVAGLVLAGSFFSVAGRTAVAIAIGLLDAVVVAAIGVIYRGYYNEIPLLFALIVAALAVVHGLRAAVPAVILGSVLVPLIAAPGTTNLTDTINAAIYLSGSAAVPWAAAQLAERRAQALQRQLRATLATEREAVLILARAAEAKDEVTGDHVARVGELAAQLALATGANAATVEGIRFAAMLHDVGKLHVPDSILLKPGRLTAAEWQVIRQHTTWGPEILGESAGFELARVIARSHHENWDGSGYPEGLRGDAIPLEARMVRIVDAFDALRSVRPYKPAWRIERCLEALAASSGTAFDPELAPMFIAIVERLFAAELAAQSGPRPTIVIPELRGARASA